MNFFEQQEKSRNATKKLLLLYTLTVIGTAFFTGLAIHLLIFKGNLNLLQNSYDENRVFYSTSTITGLFIFLVSFFKMKQLGTGGGHIATRLGASFVNSKLANHKEKVYLNIIEEMSIASGTPRPKAYILKNEQSINAFAAGLDINSAIVCVSQGAIDHLTRDELQGVVAHEFSHIFNGDMKLNIKLIGYLAGLTAINQIGYTLLRGRRHTYRRKKDSTQAIGAVLYFCGGLGALLAGWLKSSISHRREYLADASAVQFTRNPNGIGGALKKIYAYPQRGFLESPFTKEISHMCLEKSFDSFFSTHPPLSNRILTIFPKLNFKDFEDTEVRKIMEKIYSDNKAKNEQEEKTEDPSSIESMQNILLTGSILQTTLPRNDVGQFVSTISSSLRSGLYDSQISKYALISLIQPNDSPFTQKELNLTKEEYLTFQKIYHEVILIPTDMRVGLLDLALPSLEKDTPEMKKDFCLQIKKLILNDKKVSRWEWIFYSLIKLTLLEKDSFFNNHPPAHKTIKATAHLFSYLASIEEENLNKRKDIVESSMLKSFGKKSIFIEQTSLKNLNTALRIIRRSQVKYHEKILKGALHIINHNQHIHQDEKGFLKLLCEIMKVPLPL